MNHLGLVLAGTAVRVTLVGLLAMLCYVWAVRRNPAAGAWVAVVALGVFVLLTALAVCPLPDSWNWTLAIDRTAAGSRSLTPRVTRPDSTPADAAIGQGPGLSTVPSTADEVPAPLIGLWNTMRSTLARVSLPASRTTERWPACLAILFFVGAGWGSIRLLVGVAAVGRLRLRSRIVTDPAVRALQVALGHALHCTTDAEVYESDELGTAATVGWRHPLIFLPSGWRTWDEVELRTVLAHELAHVRRRDYIAVLVARLGVALHFYHPLAYWLASRLHLQQELAADAAAAPLVGGRGIYLRALARMALRQDPRSPAWPARAFLPASGTLMRRIQMLQATEWAVNGPWSATGRAVTAGLLVALALSVSALRSPAGSEVTESDGPPAKAQAPVASDHPPFELSYLPPDAIGAFGFRPADTFRQPGMAPYATAWNQYLRHFMDQIGLKPGLVIPIEDIEQVVGYFRLLHYPNKPVGQRHAIVAELSLIRMARDFDWIGHLKAQVPGLVEAQAEGHTYYRTPTPRFDHVKDPKTLPPPEPLYIVLLGGRCLFVPDSRTAVVGLEEPTARKLLVRGPGPCPACVWPLGWKQVEQGNFALAFDNRGEMMSGNVEKSDTPDIELLCRSNSRIVLGVTTADGIRIRGLAKAETEPDACRFAKLLGSGLAGGREDLRKLKATSAHNPFLVGFADDLLRQAHIDRQGTEVHFDSRAGVGLARLVEEFVMAASAGK
jgi:beta-lactamase regulating signal transducer with metallopeptidase domain